MRREPSLISSLNLSSLTRGTPLSGRLLFVLEAERHAWGRVLGLSPWGLAERGHSQDSFPPEGLRHQTACQGLTSHSPLACRSWARGEMGTASAGPCPRQPASTDSRGWWAGQGRGDLSVLSDSPSSSDICRTPARVDLWASHISQVLTHPPGINEVRQNRLCIRNQYEIGIVNSSHGKQGIIIGGRGIILSNAKTQNLGLCFIPPGEEDKSSVFCI